MKFSRLMGGASALAVAARALTDDETSGGGAAPGTEDDTEEETPEAGADENDEDEHLEEETPSEPVGEPEAGAAGDAPPVVATAASEPETPRSPAEAAAFTAGAAARNADIETVFSAKEEGGDQLIVSGREGAAAELLGGGLTAEHTLRMLAKLPRGGSADAMLTALRTNASSQPAIGPGGESEGGASKSPWGKAFKRLGWDDSKKQK